MTARRILVLKGSPRLKGNSTILAEKVEEGARKAGAIVEGFFLHKMHIEPCCACDHCHVVEVGKCQTDDDMQLLYPKLRQADALVLASPVYWFTICAQMKLCIDRWYALESPNGSALQGKQIAILLTYGDSDPFASGAINAIRAFQDMFRYMRAPIVQILHTTASDAEDVLRQPDILEKAYRLGERLAIV
jgi:multimeric flavodoxin WrbA